MSGTCCCPLEDGQILPKFQVSVDRHEHIEILLRNCEEGAIF